MTQSEQIAMNEAQQDALRPLRNFVNLLSGLAGEQSYAHADGTPWNSPYQYQTIGPTGYAIEGAPIANQPQGSGFAGNTMVLFALGAAVVYLLVK